MKARALATWLIPLFVAGPAMAKERPCQKRGRTPCSEATKQRWPLPLVIVRAGWDAPWGPSGGASVFPHERWSVSVDVSRRAFGAVGGFGVHYWPKLCRAGLTNNQINIGLGGGTFFTGAPNEGGLAVLVMPLSIDVHYIMRPIAPLGLVLGTTAGVGGAFSARDFGAHPRPSAPKDHVGFMGILYAGVSFGNFATGGAR